MHRILAIKKAFCNSDKNPAFLVPFVAFIGLLIFIFAVQPALSAGKDDNVFRQWQKKLPAGLASVPKDDLAVCAQWEAEQRRLLHRWLVTCCNRGFELKRPGLEANEYYTDVMMLGPQIVPLLTKRLEWERQLANPESIGADVKSLMDSISGSQKMPAADARDLFSNN